MKPILDKEIKRRLNASYMCQRQNSIQIKMNTVFIKVQYIKAVRENICN